MTTDKIKELEDRMTGYYDLKVFVRSEMGKVSGRGKSHRLTMFDELLKVLDASCGVAVEAGGYTLDAESDEYMADLYWMLA